MRLFYFSIPPHLRTTIEKDEIRLVVFNEQDTRPVYDTQTIIHVADGERAGAKKSPCGQFQLLRHSKDVQDLRRLVFGTLSTSIKKGSLKIHTVDKTLLLSRIFSVPKDSSKFGSAIDFNLLVGSYNSDFDSNPQYQATIRSLDALYRDDQSIKGSINGRLKNSVNPPAKFTRVRNCSLQLDGLEYDELRPFSPHQLSKVKRKQLSQRALNVNGSPCYNSGRSRLSSCSSTNENEDIRQIGFALLFNLEQKDFMFQHIFQIEEEIVNLEMGIHAATLTRPHFFQTIYNAYKRFCSSICLLHNAQRLKTPAWLSLMDSKIQTETAFNFCNQLAELINRFEHKETNFFISTLLSAVLMNHLAWVASVAPPENLEESKDRSMLIGTNEMDCTKQSYNANLAQFLELCGSVGLNCRLAKTVVIGENAELINQILFILSYFIRCSNVESRSPTAEPPPESITSTITDTCQSPPMFMGEMDDDELFKSLDSPTKAMSPPEIKPTNLKRRSSSMSACSPPYSNYCTYSDSFEPPQKTRILCKCTTYENTTMCAHEFKTLPPNSLHAMKLLMDLKDVRSTTSELFASTFAGSFSSVQDSQDSDMNSECSVESSPIGYADSLSHSLLAGVCDSYSPHFILSGVQSDSRRLEEINAEIYNDVRRHSCSRQSWCPHLKSCSSQHHSPCSDPKNISPSEISNSSSRSRLPGSANSQRSSGSDECQASVIVVVGDLHSNTIRAVSFDDQQIDEQVLVSPSETVIAMLEQFMELYHVGSDPNFLISFLEDQLGNILAKSQTLAELVVEDDTSKFITEQLRRMKAFSKSPTEHQQILQIDSDPQIPANSREEHSPDLQGVNLDNLLCEDDYEEDLQMDSMDGIENEEEKESPADLCMQTVSALLGCDCSDLRLILNVAAVYNPPVINSVLQDD
ncbi:hypothetical protein M3Y97_00673800 [Aphelenchoides bicaudatus]|nr:hypothetical protein M3Y97_00673800 [Aphelenchoides bicaudatus]